MKKKFLRSGAHIRKRLGRKKKQRWRKPRGRDNKIRENKKGNPKGVKIGFKKSDEEKKKIKVIINLKQAKEVKKGEDVLIGKIGKKKRIEIEKQIKEREGKILNKKIKKKRKNEPKKKEKTDK
jgi:large subunit ribosomal protein L32e